MLIENYSAGVIDKLGLGWDALARVNPRLVMLSSTGYGHSGPDFRDVTWGPNLEALSGLARLSGFPGRDCTMTHFAFPDPLSALHGLFAVMSALEHRDRTGAGQHISIAQVETCISAFGQVLLEQLANGREPQPLGNRSLLPRAARLLSVPRRRPLVRDRGRERREWQALLPASAWARRRALPDARVAARANAERDRRARSRPGPASATPRRRCSAAGRRRRRGRRADHRGSDAARPAAWPRAASSRRSRTRRRAPVRRVGHPARPHRHAGRTPHAGEAIGQDNDYVFGEVLGLGRAELAHLGPIRAIERSQ